MTFSLLKPSLLQKRISLMFGILGMASLAAILLYLGSNREFIREADFASVEGFVSVLVYVPLAALLAYRRPENPISWLLVLFALLRQIGFLRYVALIRLAQGVVPTPLLVIAADLWPLLSGLAFTILAFAFVIFPDGKLPSKGWRSIRWLLLFQGVSAISWIGYVCVDLFRSLPPAAEAGEPIVLIPMKGTPPLSLVLHVRTIPGVDVFFFFTAVTALVITFFGLVSQVMRFRRGGSVERQQIKWVILTMLIWVFGVIMILVPIWENSFLLSMVAPLPGIAVTLAIFRYRLYDIDIIINRALVYGTLSTSLLFVYYGSVVALETISRLLTGVQSPFSTVVATLLIAALFQPLRKRVQGLIDRAFFRNKYDAEKTLQAFAVIARDEVSIRRLTEALLVTVEDAVQPAHASLLVRSGPEKHLLQNTGKRREGLPGSSGR